MQLIQMLPPAQLWQKIASDERSVKNRPGEQSAKHENNPEPIQPWI